VRVAPSEVRINLDPAALLYLNKLGIRQRNQIPGRAVELPHVIWEVDKNRLPGITDRDLTKQWMRYFSGVYVSIAKLRGKDSAVVLLLKTTTTPARFGIEAFCPEPQLLAPLEKRDLLAKIGEDPAVANLDIRYKFGLYEDTLCPVVFVWQNATRDVLVTNEYHLNNPEQFLAIDRVGTTSGLLNFIGALSVMNVQDPAGAHYSRFPGLMREAMNAHADEWLRWFGHYSKEKVLISTKHLLVDSENSEHYFYHYTYKV
jgi:hypothetical protein